MDDLLTEMWEAWDRTLAKAERWGLGLLLMIVVFMPVIMGLALLSNPADKLTVGAVLFALLLSRMFYCTRKEIRAIRARYAKKDLE